MLSARLNLESPVYESVLSLCSFAPEFYCLFLFFLFFHARPSSQSKGMVSVVETVPFPFSQPFNPSLQVEVAGFLNYLVYLPRH